MIGLPQIRIVTTIVLSIKCRLNTKEKLFVSLSLMAKATVQAALCTVPLDSLRDGDEHADDRRSAEVFLTMCVMSILLTAPTIAILMTLLGPRLLTKTTVDPQFPENWRRHTRPSLRDISIIDEGDEDDDDDLGKLSRRSSRRRSSSSHSHSHSHKDSSRESSNNHSSSNNRETSLTTTSVP